MRDDRNRLGRRGAIATVLLFGVSPIPLNTPNVRVDEPDRVYVSAAAKDEAIIDHIIEVHASGQPVLVGTMTSPNPKTSTADWCGAVFPPSSSTPKTTRKRRPSSPRRASSRSVTVSTQMAGRGTDIRLGGSDAADDAPEKEAVADLGGAACSRHRPAPHRAAGQPVARPRRASG